MEPEVEVVLGHGSFPAPLRARKDEDPVQDVVGPVREGALGRVAVAPLHGLVGRQVVDRGPVCDESSNLTSCLA